MNIKGTIKIKVMFEHSIKGCRPLGRAYGVLIPSPCVNTTPEPFTKKFVDLVFSGFSDVFLK